MENSYDLGINLEQVINESNNPVIIDLGTVDQSVNAEDKMRDPNKLKDTSQIFVYYETLRSRSGLCISVRKSPGWGWYQVLFFGGVVYHRSITDTQGTDGLYQVANSWTNLIQQSNQQDFNISNYIVDILYSQDKTKALSANQGRVLLNEIYKVDRKLYNEITTIDKYYNDGSGQVVPIRHPDLSTQPNILPYKFMGQYVYEQLIPSNSYYPDPFYFPKSILAVDKPIFLEAFGFGRWGSFPCEVRINEYNVDSVQVNNLGINTGAWDYIRIVYTSMPEEGSYYGYNNY